MEQQKQFFDSVILAGGFGTRLAPLTDSVPKPLLQIAGISAYERTVSLLRKNGFLRTAVTTMYLPERLEALKLKGVVYLREEKPLGSAGAVGRLKPHADDCILVISGDAVCSYDLASAKAEFLKSECDAAMLLCRVKDAGEYGSVCVSNGCITGFCEKPSVRDTLSDLVNTGIYFIKKELLDLIPENKNYDFARDLFPALLKQKHKIAGIVPEGNWFDIGSFGEYHRCNMWFSNGENCFGKRISVHVGARIEHSVIMDGCTIGNSVIKGCIIGEGAVIGNGCILPPGCVIGPGAELRDGAALAPGSIVQTGEARLGEAFVEAFPRPKHILNASDDSVIAEDADEGYFVRLGKMLGGGAEVISFAEGGAGTLVQACELACGAAESGSNCTVISGGNAALASFAAAEHGCKPAFIYKEDGRTEIRLFSPDGMPFSREELRRLSGTVPEKANTAGSVYLMPHGALLKRYLKSLEPICDIPKSIKVCNNAESTYLRECAEELFISKSEGDAEFSLADNGEKAYARLPDGSVISYWQLIAICCIEGGRNGIILPNDTPDSVERILRRNSVDVAFYGDSESEVRRLAECDRLHRDGILLALTACAVAEKCGRTLAELAKKLPPFSILTRHIFADRDKMCSVISKIREKCGNARCAGFEFGEGRVNVYASASGRFRLIAEATDSETCEEITLRAIDQLSK